MIRSIDFRKFVSEVPFLMSQYFCSNSLRWGGNLKRSCVLVLAESLHRKRWLDCCRCKNWTSPRSTCKPQWPDESTPDTEKRREAFEPPNWNRTLVYRNDARTGVLSQFGGWPKRGFLVLHLHDNLKRPKTKQSTLTAGTQPPTNYRDLEPDPSGMANQPRVVYHYADSDSEE